MKIEPEETGAAGPEDSLGPAVPRRPRVLDGHTLRRLGAEFVVIVVGVLVAFAVDDWQAGIERREVALRLIGTMEADIEASVEDLREAASSALIRQSALVELLALSGEPLPPAEEWTPWSEVDLGAARGAVMRQLGGRPSFQMLVTMPAYVQVFDPRTASFDELRNTGALATIPDPDVQREIVEYFALILDFAESNQFLRTDQFALQAAWQEAGIIAGDWIDQDEFLARLRGHPGAVAAIRRNYTRAFDQRTGYSMLADSLSSQGGRIVARARASLR